MQTMIGMLKLLNFTYSNLKQKRNTKMFNATCAYSLHDNKENLY